MKLYISSRTKLSIGLSGFCTKLRRSMSEFGVRRHAHAAGRVTIDHVSSRITSRRPLPRTRDLRIWSGRVVKETTDKLLLPVAIHKSYPLFGNAYKLFGRILIIH